VVACMAFSAVYRYHTTVPGKTILGPPEASVKDRLISIEIASLFLRQTLWNEQISTVFSTGFFRSIRFRILNYERMETMYDVCKSQGRL